MIARSGESGDTPRGDTIRRIVEKTDRGLACAREPSAIPLWNTGTGLHPYYGHHIDDHGIDSASRYVGRNNTKLFYQRISAGSLVSQRFRIASR